MRWFLIGFFCFRIAAILGQPITVKQLKRACSSETSAEKKVTLLNELSWACYTSGNGSFKYYAEKALGIANRKRLTENALIARLQLIEYQRNEGQLEEASDGLKKVERQITQRYRANCFPLLLLVKGNLALSDSEIDKAATCYKKGYGLNPTYRNDLQIEFCLKLAEIEHEKEYFKSERRFLREACLNAQQSGKVYREILALNNLGMSYTMSQDFDQAQLNFFKSSSLAKKWGDQRGQSRALLNCGNIAYYKGDWAKAIAYFTKSARINESLKDQEGIAMINNNIGAIYKEQKRYTKSIEYFQKAKIYYEQSGDSIALADAWVNIAGVEILTNKRKEAVIRLKKAIQFLKEKEQPTTLLVAYTNLAFAYTEMGNYVRALDYLAIADKAAQQLHDQHTRVFIFNLYGANHFYLKSYSKAINYYTRSYELGKELGLVNEQKKALFGLYEAEQKAGNFQQALTWHETYGKLKDSLLNTENQAQLTLLEEKYDTKQKVQEITNLHAQNKTISLKNKLTSNQLKLSLVTVVLVFVAIVFMSVLFYQRIKRQKMALQYTRERNAERVDQLLKDQEISILETGILAQQTERKKLAKDIHDNLGSYLATIKYQHEVAAPPVDDSVLFNHYAITSKLIADACAEVRAISHQMATGLDVQFSLIPAINELITRIQTTRQFEIHFSHFPETIQIEHEVALALYKVIQELLSNTLKHAGASNVELHINQHAEEINVLLEDNGCGFNVQTTHTGIGLLNIRERMAQLNGKMEINSTPHDGTTCLLILPLNFIET
ncbi:MAG: sensor histidine kinase [Fluviicola sp.]|nr:sensor histidine kinase [Fluviicola sp.]